jgi:hypothetical protein
MRSHIRTSSPHGRGLIRGLVSVCGLLALAAALPHPVQALPSYARQTGQDCAACHVGGFGPQLTAYGTKFKIGGYTDSNGEPGHLPLSAMFMGTYSHTQKDQVEDAGPYAGVNNNLVAQEVTAFLAGGLTKNLGTFVEAGYSGVDNVFALGEMDVRFANSVQLGGKDTVMGVTLNNNPSVTDPFNTLPAWRFPYTASDLAPTPAASTLLEGGLEGQVLGASAYGFWDDSVYAELGGYRSLSRSSLHSLGLTDDAGEIDGVAPYWRLGYMKDNRKSAYSFGVFGLYAKLQPDRVSGPTNNYRDIGVDGSYQFLGTRKHMLSLSGSYINEHQTRDFTFDEGGAADRTGTLQSLNINGSYTYQQTYGITLGLSRTWGDKDALLYPEETQSGSRTGSPDSTAWVLDANWTPFGKESSWSAPWVNLRLGLQYTLYTEFNGSSSNYDGSGRDASDNNTLFSYLWLSI